MTLVVSDFEALAQAITSAYEHLLTKAMRAVNVHLTVRNWLIGCYIHEYQMGGTDRATYGEGLLSRLADRLTAGGLRNCSERELRRYRQFYLAYPRVAEALTPEVNQLLPASQAAIAIRGTLSPESMPPGRSLITELSFSHLKQDKSDYSSAMSFSLSIWSSTIAF